MKKEKKRTGADTSQDSFSYNDLIDYFGAKNCKIIKLRGYYNNENYNVAKNSYGKWEPTSENEASYWIKAKGWLGLVIPDGYILVDVDNFKVGKKLYKAMKKNHRNFIGIRTPNGYHFIFKDSKKVETQTTHTLTTGGFVIDYKLAKKGYIVLPTENTENRKVKYIPDVRDLDYMPDIFLPVRQAKEEDAATDIPIDEGSRDINLYKHACRLREWNEKHQLRLGHDGILTILRTMNELFCEPPMEDKIVEEKVTSAMRYKTENTESVPISSGNSTADKMIKIARNYSLFVDDAGKPCACVNRVVYQIESVAFKRWIINEYMNRHKKVAGKNEINTAIHAVAAIASNNGSHFSLYNRVAERGNVFYYDMGEGKVVVTKKTGWKIKDHTTILFKHYQHQKAQVMPKRKGNINDIFKFVNIKCTNSKLLFLVYLVSCLVPGIPHPVIHIYGPQGSGKTVIFKVLRELIDPSNNDDLILPDKRRETIRKIEHHYLCLFDNLSSCKDELSDLLSQACTGAGISMRQLYTDDEDITYKLLRCIGINGINLLVSRPDLMDRTLLFQINRITPDKREGLREMMRKFDRVRPYILGAMFDTLSRAKEIYTSLKVKKLERMADFMKWGVAITEALGYKNSDFKKAYKENINHQNEEIIHSDSLAQAVLELMKTKKIWQGTVKEAYDKLRKHVETKNDSTFPRHTNKLRNALERIKPNLSAYGIDFEVSNNHTENGVPMNFINRNLVEAIKKQNKYPG